MSGSTARSLSGEVVLITGCSSGIGEATVLLLAQCGAKLVLGARRNDRLAALTARIAGAGGTAVHLVTDVRRRGDLTSLVEMAQERFGKLDVLVSNAGIGPISPLDSLRVDEWEDMVDVNIKGVLYGVAAALPVFRAQGFGHFITVASTAGLKTVSNQSVYSATKFAVRAFCEGLRQEAGDKLRVVVYGQEGLTNTYAIDASGVITMPLIGRVPARGRTPTGLASEISAKLRNGYIREPSVAVEVETYRPFFILGEVAAPGQYPYVPNMTVESAVAIAGGFSPRARRDSVTVTHTDGTRAGFK